jgi:hypothetical protein
MKKRMLILLSLAGAGLAAQAQLENTVIILAPAGGPVLVGGAPPPPVFVPVVYDRPVTYNAPVQYYAPVVYNAPVFYNTVPPPAPLPPSREVVCAPPACVPCPTTTVQVISFGHGQAVQQGYNFTARR